MLATMLARSEAVPDLSVQEDPSGKEGRVIAVDGELTSLSWLQKPGVLTSMCTALTGSPHHVNKLTSGATRAQRRPPRHTGVSAGGKEKAKIDSERMFSVILNVRNKKYNGEDTQKPPLSFAAMIFMSLESSPTKTLPVKDIYEWIQWKFPFYQTAPPGWKNSVRHNLSLNKCFKKVSRGLSSKSKTSSFSKGGLWTVDADYRRSLLAALKRSPYHPYHSYFTPPLSPSSSCSSLENLDPAERDAALTMCMIGGGREGSPAGIIYAVCHDHCYAKRPPKKYSSSKISKSLSLAEVAAAAEMILEQDKMESEECWNEEEEEEEEEDDDEEDECLTDSGYGETSPDVSHQNMEEVGADALLALSCATNNSS